MKHNFTKLMAIVAILLMSVWSVNAQTSTYSGTYPITMQGFVQICTNPVAAGWAGSTSSASTSARNGKCFTTADDANFNSGRNITYRLPVCGTITLQANGTLGRGFIITVKKVSDATQLSRTVWAYDNATCSSTNIVVNSAEPVNITILSPTSTESPITGTGSSYLSYVNISGLPVPQITAFTAAGVSATINQSTKKITAELPYGTNLTSIEPVVTTGGTANDYSPKGAQDFSGGSVNYIATDGTPANDVTYAVTLTAAAVPSSEKDLSNVMIGGKTPTFNAGTNTYSVILPKASSLTQAVTFTKPGTATANFTSGATHDFTNPLQITVTAQDASTKEYTITAQAATKNIAYIINTAVDAKDTKIRPMLASKYYLENILIANVTTTTDFTSYDMVILTEAPSSGSAGMKALWGINKPLFCMKIYTLQANTWNLSTASNPSPAATTVAINEPNHPIFNGVTFTGTYSNEIEMFDAISAGNGVQTTPYAGIYNLANVKGLATTGILELPAGTASPMTGTTNANLQQKLLFVSIANDNQNIVTDNALKVIDNAVNYLTGTTVWGTNAGTQFKDIPVTGGGTTAIGETNATIHWNTVPGTAKYIVSQSVPAGIKSAQRVKSEVNIDVEGNLTSYEITGLTPNTSYNYTVTAQNAAGVNSLSPAPINFLTLSTGVSALTIQGVTFDGKIIHNANNQLLNVFDTTGRKVASATKDINMSAQAKGVYLVKGENGIMKIAVTK